MNIRQVVLDTETTGLDVEQGHRVIEIGCVELINRKITNNHFHQYINPMREIDQGAFEVHGISNDDLRDKPEFSAIAEDLAAYLRGAELVIHNAPFDLGFLNAEFALVDEKYARVEEYCEVVDTLVSARQLHPGLRNDLNSLCSRYDIDNSQRTLHGALLDAEILAEVYLAMTGGQTSMLLDEMEGDPAESLGQSLTSGSPVGPLRVVEPSDEEMSGHEKWLEILEESGDGPSMWARLESQGEG